MFRLLFVIESIYCQYSLEALIEAVSNVPIGTHYYSPALKKVGLYWICHVLLWFRDSVILWLQNLLNNLLCLWFYFNETYTTLDIWGK